MRPDCVLATNTASLPVSAMAAGLQHPERVVGLHFFNPVAVMPLVEVVRAQHTSDRALATALRRHQGAEEVGVLVVGLPRLRRQPGAHPAAGRGHALPSTTARTLETVDASLDPLALPMSPFALLELVGTGVAAHVVGAMHRAFPDRFAHSADPRRAGRVRTPHRLDADRGAPHIDPEVAALVPPAATEPPAADAGAATGCSARWPRRSALMLDEGVVGAAADIDLCMVLGAGWPFWLGGITPYLDRTGTSTKVRGRPFHSGPPSATD